MTQILIYVGGTLSRVPNAKRIYLFDMKTKTGGNFSLVIETERRILDYNSISNSKSGLIIKRRGEQHFFHSLRYQKIKCLLYFIVNL